MGGGGDLKSFHSLKGGGGSAKSFTLCACLEGGGGAQIVSDPRFSHFVAPLLDLRVINDQSLIKLLVRDQSITGTGGEGVATQNGRGKGKSNFTPTATKIWAGVVLANG